MQLQYCDGCSTRIDVEKAVTDGDKIYCHDCAVKLGLGHKAPGGSGSRPAPGASGSRLAAAASGSRLAAGASGARPGAGSSGTRTVALGGGATRTTGSGSGLRPAMRPPSVLRRPVANPPGRSTPSGTSLIQKVGRRVPTPTETTKVALAAPPIQSPGAGAAAAAAAPAAPAAAAEAAAEAAGATKSSTTLARVLMVAGIVLGIVGLVLIIRGGKGQRQRKPAAAVKGDAKTPATTAQHEPKTGTPAPDKTAQQAAKTITPEPDRGPPSKDQTALPPARAAGLGMFSQTVDIRGERAQREVDALLELDKSGKGNPFDKRKRWEAFAASSSGRTEVGQKAAAERLKALPDMKSRPPDAPANTQPGLEARVYELATDRIVLKNLSLTGLKQRCVKVLPNVDLPDRKSIGALADGREELVLVRLSGYVDIPREGVYSFWSNSDDGSLVYIGDNLVVINEEDHPAREAGGPMQYPLQAGKHVYRADYFQGLGEAALVLSWSGPGIPKQIMPASAFSH